MDAVNRSDTALVRQKASALLGFRHEAREQLRMNWRVLFSTQHRMGDATGITSLLIEPRVQGRKAFAAVHSQTPPTIDGQLDETLWMTGRAPLGLADNATADAPKAGTTVHLAWDAEALYIGLDCDEPLMADVLESVSERDGPAWTDNAVEIFVDGASSGKDFHQLILTSAGALLDGRMVDGAFSSSWDMSDEELQYAVSRHDVGWRVELRLTWAGLAMSQPDAGSTLRFNITRDRNVVVADESEATALSPTFGGFHAPARFATLTLR
jgi:hypothetical protein